MAVNPLVAAIAAFSQGEMQGREKKRRAERDWAADVQTQRQAERQGALDRAAQEFQQFQMKAPERAELQRTTIQGEQDRRNAAKQQAAHAMIDKRFGPEESGGEFRPDFDYAAHYDNLLANARAQAQAEAAAQRGEASEDRRDARQMRGLQAIAERQGATASRAQQQAQERRRDATTKVDNWISDIDVALGEVETNPDAFGLKNYAPKPIRENLPWRDAGADATTLGSLEWIVGELRHGRFGAALTQGEASRAMRIFSEPTSKPSVVAAQLKYIKSRLEAHRQRQVQGAEDSAAGAPVGGGTGGVPSFEEWQAAKKKRGA